MNPLRRLLPERPPTGWQAVLRAARDAGPTPELRTTVAGYLAWKRSREQRGMIARLDAWLAERRPVSTTAE